VSQYFAEQIVNLLMAIVTHQRLEPELRSLPALFPAPMSHPRARSKAKRWL